MINQKNLYLVVMAGGSGTRFWPKSTSKLPKQLLAFGNQKNNHNAHKGSESVTLLEQTLNRFQDWIPRQQRLILTTQFLKNAVELKNLEAEILAEPQGRNTAPCLYWSAKMIAQKNPEAIMMVMPSDHYIARPDRFIAVVKQAAAWASEHDDLVTLGIQPTRAETGYGYLKTGDLLESFSDPICGSLEVRKVAAFVEKPNLSKAEEFVKSGQHLWNGGMFLWRVETVLKAFDEWMPEMKKVWDESHGDVEKAYPRMTATSIDYGVMEKAQNVVTFPMDCGWDDLGSWTSLESVADELCIRVGENVVMSGEIVSCLESRGNIIDLPHHQIALLGVEDLVIVQKETTILIASKNRAQEIRLVVEDIKQHRSDLV